MYRLRKIQFKARCSGQIKRALFDLMKSIFQLSICQKIEYLIGTVIKLL